MWVEIVLLAPEPSCCLYTNHQFLFWSSFRGQHLAAKCVHKIWVTGRNILYVGRRGGEELVFSTFLERSQEYGSTLRDRITARERYGTCGTWIWVYDLKECDASVEKCCHHPSAHGSCRWRWLWRGGYQWRTVKITNIKPFHCFSTWHHQQCGQVSLSLCLIPLNDDSSNQGDSSLTVKFFPPPLQPWLYFSASTFLPNVDF